MASVRLTPRPPATTGAAPVTAPPPLDPSSARRRWPASAGRRWLVRLGLALPLVGLAVLAARGGFVSVAHRGAAAQATALVDGGAQLHGIGAAYPPVPVLLATALPGGALALGVVAALAAGTTLHLVWELLLSLDLPRPLVAVLMAPVVAVPAVGFLGSQSVGTIVSISLTTVALLGFIRFTVSGSTEGGFMAGIAFALAFLASPIALFYALATGASTALLGTDRHDARGATSAAVGVLLFPTVFAAGAWAFLEWRFTGHAYASVFDAPSTLLVAATRPGFVGAVVAVGLGLLHVPLYLACGLLQARRRPVTLVGYLMPVVGSVVAVWAGLRFTEITVYVFVTVLALAAVPRRPGRAATALLVAAALGQLVLAWVRPPTGVGFDAWAAAVLAALMTGH